MLLLFYPQIYINSPLPEAVNFSSLMVIDAPNLETENMKLLLLFPLFLMFSCTTSESEYLLNEDFSENRLGWVEEWSEAHRTEIIEGKLLIKSLDTAANYSSNGPRDQSIFWSLPDKWQFSTSLEVIDGGEEAGFGFLLYSASLNYQFSVNRKGELSISEYDYNKQKERKMVEKVIENFSLDYNSPAILTLSVTGDSFSFYLDEEKVGEGSFRAKSWETLRLFAKAGGTGIKSDYYRLKAL